MREMNTSSQMFAHTEFMSLVILKTFWSKLILKCLKFIWDLKSCMDKTSSCFILFQNYNKTNLNFLFFYQNNVFRGVCCKIVENVLHFHQSR